MDDDNGIHPALAGTIDEIKQVYQRCVHITGDPATAWAMTSYVLQCWRLTHEASQRLEERAKGLVIEKVLVQASQMAALKADAQPLIERLYAIRKQGQSAA